MRALRWRWFWKTVACGGARGLWWCELRELATAALMLPAIGGGVKARVAHRVLSLRRCVPKYPCDELAGLEPQGLASMIAMIGVAEAHCVGGQVEPAVPRQRAALDIARQVQRDAPAMRIGLGDLDIPVKPVVLSDDALPVGGVVHGWKMQALLVQRLAETRQELAAEEMLQWLDRNQEVRSARLPLSVIIDAPGADEAVHMRMLAERSSPGMQRHEDARQRTEVTFVGAQLEQTLTRAVEEQLVHAAAVELPQSDERVRQREDDVEVRAREQALEFGLEPLTTWPLGTARTAPMVARMVLDDAAVAVGARQGV